MCNLPGRFGPLGTQVGARLVHRKFSRLSGRLCGNRNVCAHVREFIHGIEEFPERQLPLTFRYRLPNARNTIPVSYIYSCFHQTSREVIQRLAYLIVYKLIGSAVSNLVLSTFIVHSAAFPQISQMLRLPDGTLDQ